MGTMRVLLLTFGDIPGTDAAWLVDQAVGCTRSGHEPVLLGPADALADAWRDADLGFAELEAGPPMGSGFGAIAATANCASFVGSVAKTFDLLHVLDPAATTTGLLAGRAARVPVLLHEPGRTSRWAAGATTTDPRGAEVLGAKAVVLDTDDARALATAYERTAR